MFNEMQSAGSGGGAVNPTILKNLYQKTAINESITIDTNKTYLVTADYVRDSETYTTWMVQNGSLSVLQHAGYDSFSTVGRLELSGTTLTYSRDSASYNIHMVMYQLD